MSCMPPFHRMKNGSRRLCRSKVLLAALLSYLCRLLVRALWLLRLLSAFLTLNRVVEVDDFIAGLWRIHLAVKKEGYVQVDCCYQQSRDLKLE